MRERPQQSREPLLTPLTLLHEPSIDMIRLISTRFEVPMAESCHISVEQAEDCMSALLPNLKRWRRQDEIDAVEEGK
ncbi:zinc ribbon domain-containing protein [Bifidobacterium longum]|uniref:zinc ribbon domain-containing protein n=1 Tax=Bifidobacterium longum TaxID=216816 RepID=UPI001F199B38|nr:zinc ribbon domain-containing protein [Bifidobacterium longum]